MNADLLFNVIDYTTQWSVKNLPFEMPYGKESMERQ